MRLDDGGGREDVIGGVIKRRGLEGGESEGGRGDAGRREGSREGE